MHKTKITLWLTTEARSFIKGEKRTYTVVRAQNTTSYWPGRKLSAGEVQGLIEGGWTINISASN
jgi:hypothetical protein